MLFLVFIPASILVDFMRGFGGEWATDLPQQQLGFTYDSIYRTWTVLHSNRNG